MHAKRKSTISTWKVTLHYLEVNHKPFDLDFLAHLFGKPKLSLHGVSARRLVRQSVRPYRPPRANQLSDSCCQSQHPDSNPTFTEKAEDIHKIILLKELCHACRWAWWRGGCASGCCRSRRSCATRTAHWRTRWPSGATIACVSSRGSKSASSATRSWPPPTASCRASSARPVPSASTRPASTSGSAPPASLCARTASLPGSSGPALLQMHGRQHQG